MNKKLNIIWQTPPDSLWQFDWISSLFPEYQLNYVVDTKLKLVLENSVIVCNFIKEIDHVLGGSYGQYHKYLKRFNEYIEAFKKEGKSVGFIHMGDQYFRESISFYKNIDFIFREHYREEAHKKYPQCYYLPLGYKKGFVQELVDKNVKERKYYWSFAGQLKASRYTMIESAKRIPGGQYYVTTQWNDPKGLTTQEYAALLNDTVFALCPMGNYSLDCFRVYEALEAGAIPVIESHSMKVIFKKIFNLKYLVKYRDIHYWSRTHRYWQRAYGSDFPCLQITDWRNLEYLLGSTDVEKTAEQVKTWWENYKSSLIKFIEFKVEESFYLKKLKLG
ncbi:MAG: exostosin family protein [Cyanobacteria bacterium J06592_8]